jgi:asparagine synthase (glutamine-hydrolysing)
MTRAVRHRGPDGEGFAFYQPNANRVVSVLTDESPRGTRGEREVPAGCTFALGHRRLSIVDLSVAGHQPMADATAAVWITFNGEIYNYPELRAELVAAGHVFHSGTDTEVILAAWREWGKNCLSRFNGMFAFVLFDQRTQEVFVARDRFGVKPVYLWRTAGGGLALASEIKQFTFHPHWKARLNGQRAYDFLNWGLSDHTRETMFADVEQLRGGEFILAPLSALSTAPAQRWYDLRGEPFTGDFVAASARFRELLDDSVRLRLRSDVPVGSCLSGGLDSSSIVCTMRAQLGEQAAGKQNTFSAYSDVARFDERSFIEEVVRNTGATPHHLTPDPRALLKELDALTWHQDEPFGSTSIYAQWCVCRLARENGVIVMLDGQGADEALGGYHGYFGKRIAGLLRRGRWARAWQEARAVRHLHGQSWNLQTRLMANELLPSGVADRLRRWVGRTTRAPEFIDLDRLHATATSPFVHASDSRNPVRSFSEAQLTSLNLPMLLHWEDRDSMAHSVEARLPFLDYRLVEFCLGLPEDFKLSDGWTKRVLREGMRGRLPERVRERRDKLGFATAEEVWMRGPQREEFLQLVAAAVATAGGLLTPAAQEKAARMLGSAEPFSFLTWRFISFGKWLQRFDVEIPAAKSPPQRA